MHNRFVVNKVVATAQVTNQRFEPAGIYESHNAGREWTKVADTSQLVARLLLINDQPAAPGNSRLARYYTTSPELGPSLSWLDLSKYAYQLNGMQILILGLSASLAALALIGRPEWVAPSRQINMW